jgi:hypothetical protein
VRHFSKSLFLFGIEGKLFFRVSTITHAPFVHKDVSKNISRFREIYRFSIPYEYSTKTVFRQGASSKIDAKAGVIGDKMHHEKRTRLMAGALKVF